MLFWLSPDLPSPYRDLKLEVLPDCFASITAGMAKVNQQLVMQLHLMFADNVVGLRSDN